MKPSADKDKKEYAGTVRKLIEDGTLSVEGIAQQTCDISSEEKRRRA